MGGKTLIWGQVLAVGIFRLGLTEFEVIEGQAIVIWVNLS